MSEKSGVVNLQSTKEVFIVLSALLGFIFCYPRSKPSKINIER
jgi:hypothetical protein